ncbi:MAG: hypothetical protein LBU82_06405 [Treponema sp.]|jgi:hypothetical protein|nr:hypothetical protein [Treponema sp.]
MKRFLFLLLFVLTCALTRAQDAGSYLIPRTAYVGDRATFVLPVPELRGENANITLAQDAPGFPHDESADFHMVTLERRGSGSRLLIEFTAFAPGVLELPVIEIGEMVFSRLSVKISSVIDPDKPVLELAGPAPSLAIPGTALLFYGAIAGFAAFMAVAVWFLFNGRRFLNGWIEKWRLWNLFTSMRALEKRLGKSLSRGAGNREIIDKLSAEFRVFLSYLSGQNCRAMTAREMETLPAGFDRVFLLKFFTRCDELRFSGGAASAGDVFRLLSDMRAYVGMLEKAGKSGLEEKKAA